MRISDREKKRVACIHKAKSQRRRATLSVELVESCDNTKWEGSGSGSDQDIGDGMIDLKAQSMSPSGCSERRLER